MFSSPVRNGFSHRTVVAATNAAVTFEMRGQRPGAQLRADAALAQLGVREIEVIAPLGDVIGELVADREPEPSGATVRPDDVQPDDFGLFAEIRREIGRDDRAATPDEDVAIALVEPLRLHAGPTVGRAASRGPPLEHPHRIREGRIARACVFPFRCMASRVVALPR